MLLRLKDLAWRWIERENKGVKSAVACLADQRIDECFMSSVHTIKGPNGHAGSAMYLKVSRVVFNPHHI